MLTSCYTIEAPDSTGRNAATRDLIVLVSKQKNKSQKAPPLKRLAMLSGVCRFITLNRDTIRRGGMQIAVSPNFRRDALLTRDSAEIAGLLGTMHEAKRAMDMRKYPFWARYEALWMRCSSPRPERYCAIARRLCRAPKKE